MPPTADAPPLDPGALPAPEVEIALEDPRWAAELGGEAGIEALAAAGAAMALQAAGVEVSGRAVSFLFADDPAVAELNGAYRGKEAPTNVLSWPAYELRAEAAGRPDGAAPDLPPAPEPPEIPGFDAGFDDADGLGDLALAFPTCAREAEALGLSLRDHALHLIVHGVLHLLGYDHEREADAALMEGLESRAMLAAGLADPYLPRQELLDEEKAAPAGAAERNGSDDL